MFRQERARIKESKLPPGVEKGRPPASYWVSPHGEKGSRGKGVSPEKGPGVKRSISPEVDKIKVPNEEEED